MQRHRGRGVTWHVTWPLRSCKIATCSWGLWTLGEPHVFSRLQSPQLYREVSLVHPQPPSNPSCESMKVRDGGGPSGQVVQGWRGWNSVTQQPRVKNKESGTPLVVQWLRLSHPMWRAQVQPLVRELDPTSCN